jgi:hypothetical protein
VYGFDLICRILSFGPKKIYVLEWRSCLAFATARAGIYDWSLTGDITAVLFGMGGFTHDGFLSFTKKVFTLAIGE